MLRKLALLAALSPVLWLSTATAIGLGEIEVKSGLNQRFAASIPLTSTSPEEAEGVQVTLASVAEFQRAGLDRSDYLSSLRFTVASDGGQPRIEVRSAQIAREPFVNFLVEVKSRGGRLLREYTILLDPPSMPQPAAPVAQAPRTPAPVAVAPQRPSSEFFETSEESVRRPAPVAQAAPAEPVRPTAPPVVPVAPAPVAAPAPAAPLSSASGDAYGPVQPKETFWSIATKLRPDPSLTMDQVLLAIYEANRGAFDGGINGLRIGSQLTIPSAAEMGSVPPATAKARVTALRNGGVAKPKPRPAEAAAEPPIKAPKPSIVSEAPAVPASPSPAKPAPAAKPLPAPKPVPVPAPAPEPKPVPKPEPKAAAPVPVPVPAPAPEPVPAPAPAAVEPAPAAPAVSEAPAAPIVSEAPVEAPAADAAVTAEAPVVEAEPAPVPKKPKAPKPAPEPESGLVDLLAPLLGLLLVLGGVGYLVSNVLKKRRAQQMPDLPPAAPAAGMPSLTPVPSILSRSTLGTIPPQGVKLPPKSPEAARRELENLDDTLNGEETADFNTKQLRTQQVPPQAQSTQIIPPAPSHPSLDDTAMLPTFDSTQAFGAEDLAFARKAVETGNIDFDVTGQFAAETVQINLDANDPMAEADFHLAYGLYDEAILLLRQASGRDPSRTELKVKLAETYFAAGRPVEFQETAETLKGRVDDAAWQKIAIMGQQLCPDVQMFKGGDVTAVDTDFDLGFDEPSAPSFESMPEPSAAEAPPVSAGNGLDFRLEELELPPMETASKSREPALKNEDALEFDLGDFDLGGAKPAPAAPAAAASRMDDTYALEFDLSGFDSPAASTMAGPAMAEIKVDEIHLDDFDIGDLGGDSDSISAGDESSTKLDLARAYVDMGDNEMARNLLTEVQQQGNDTQKAEAQALLSRLA